MSRTTKQRARKWLRLVWLALGWPAVVTGAIVMWHEAVGLVLLVAVAWWLAGALRGLLRQDQTFLVRLLGLCLVVPVLLVPRSQFSPPEYQSLDVVAQPTTYKNLSISELCRQIGRDHGLWINDGLELADRVVSFQIDRPMTHRAVLEKMAADLDIDIHVSGYCGTCGVLFIFAERKAGPKGRVVSLLDR